MAAGPRDATDVLLCVTTRAATVGKTIHDAAGEQRGADCEKSVMRRAMPIMSQENVEIPLASP